MIWRITAIHPDAQHQADGANFFGMNQVNSL